MADSVYYVSTCIDTRNKAVDDVTVYKVYREKAQDLAKAYSSLSEIGRKVLDTKGALGQTALDTKGADSTTLKDAYMKKLEEYDNAFKGLSKERIKVNKGQLSQGGIYEPPRVEEARYKTSGFLDGIFNSFGKYLGRKPETPKKEEASMRTPSPWIEKQIEQNQAYRPERPTSAGPGTGESSRNAELRKLYEEGLAEKTKEEPVPPSEPAKGGSVWTPSKWREEQIKRDQAYRPQGLTNAYRPEAKQGLGEQPSEAQAGEVPELKSGGSPWGPNPWLEEQIEKGTIGTSGPKGLTNEGGSKEPIKIPKTSSLDGYVTEEVLSQPTSEKYKPKTEGGSMWMPLPWLEQQIREGKIGTGGPHGLINAYSDKAKEGLPGVEPEGKMPDTRTNEEKIKAYESDLEDRMRRFELEPGESPNNAFWKDYRNIEDELLNKHGLTREMVDAYDLGKLPKEPKKVPKTEEGYTLEEINKAIKDTVNRSLEIALKEGEGAPKDQTDIDAEMLAGLYKVREEQDKQGYPVGAGLEGQIQKYENRLREKLGEDADNYISLIKEGKKDELLDRKREHYHMDLNKETVTKSYTTGTEALKDAKENWETSIKKIREENEAASNATRGFYKNRIFEERPIISEKYRDSITAIRLSPNDRLNWEQYSSAREGNTNLKTNYDFLSKLEKDIENANTDSDISRLQGEALKVAKIILAEEDSLRAQYGFSGEIGAGMAKAFDKEHGAEKKEENPPQGPAVQSSPAPQATA